MWFKKASRDSAPEDGRAAPERLGVINTGSGELLLVDFGELEFWSGDRTPVVEDGLLDPELTDRINAAVDLEIVGPDAVRVGDLMDLAAVSGTYVFDIPRDAPELQERLAAVCGQHGLEASLRVIGRMPHRERMRRGLDRSPTGIEVPFNGVWAVGVRDVPRDAPLVVYGERMDAQGPDSGRWRSVWVQCAEGEATSSRLIGYVLVDQARLMFADPDALSGWNVGDPTAGLADLVFWGRDEEAVAGHLGANAFEESGGQVYGWRDVPFDEAMRLGATLHEHLEARSAKVATDFRPHDDNHRILASMRESSTESATLEVDGRQVCGFFTTWGDGAFPVFRDEGSDSELLRIRVELGAAEIITRTRRMEELWFGSLSKLAIASPAVARGAPVVWLERDQPRNEQDSGWCLYAGTETQDELDEPGAASLIPLRDIISSQPDLEAILSTPAPAAFERTNDGGWRPNPPERD
ncbi:MAG: DUF2185 domain-containing protein [Nocardioidaceae bacterium]